MNPRETAVSKTDNMILPSSRKKYRKWYSIVKCGKAVGKLGLARRLQIPL